MAEQDRGFEALLEYLKQSRGFDFTAYKRNSLMRRIQKRMQAVKIDSFDEYLDYLQVRPDEFIDLFNTILINVTRFFRDTEAWAFLRTEIVPPLIGDKSGGEAIRVWSAACASGEEAYSLAMLFAEALGPEAFKERVKIYGTDVDEPALNRARSATYSEAELEGVPAELLDRYFESSGERRSFRKDLRRSIIFGRNDLIQDAPISRLDLIACRNVLMYFNAEAQTRVLTRFAFALNPTGYLFLGKAETLLTRSDVFVPVQLEHRIFIKPERSQQRLLMAAPTASGQAGPPPPADRLRDMAIERDSVAQIIVDSTGVLTVANSAARQMFGVGQRDIGRPLQDLELSYRPVELRSMLERAYTEREEVAARDVHWMRGTESRWIDILVMPLFDAGGAPMGAKVGFLDTTVVRKLQQDLNRSRQELETAYEELQSTNEELQTTNEELQSTIEELETTNEELQSTNEELETMNEELESTNAELAAANTELESRGHDLNRSNAFLEAVLASINAGVVVLDRDLLVLAWNGGAEELWGLRAGEVKGKNFMVLDIGLPVQDLQPLLRAVLQGDSGERQARLKAVNRRGRTVEVQIRVSPLPGRERTVAGTVVLMEAVSGANATA